MYQTFQTFVSFAIIQHLLEHRKEPDFGTSSSKVLKNLVNISISITVIYY